jgi:hypothetical protein
MYFKYDEISEKYRIGEAKNDKFIEEFRYVNQDR